MNFWKGLASAVIPGYGAYQGQKSANQTNIQLAREGREHDVNMWNRQNAYNTPEMQMQRLKEAGLNPNLIYGSGQASAGNADAPKQAHVANVSNEMATFANNNAIQLLSQYNDWQVKKAQIKNIDAETESKSQDNAIKAFTLPYAESMAQDNAHRTQGLAELTRYQARSLSQAYREQLQSSSDRMGLHSTRLGESKQRIDYLKQSTRQKMLDNELNEQLKPYGMTTSDALWQRMLAPLLKNSAKGIFDFMDNPGKHFKKTFLNK